MGDSITGGVDDYVLPKKCKVNDDFVELSRLNIYALPQAKCGGRREVGGDGKAGWSESALRGAEASERM